MMTSEQIQQLRRDETAMMAEWSASSVQPCCFNTDGIVDYERWAALPGGKHIVVLLKETNALSGSLVDFLSHGGSKTYYRTWNNVARWINMVLNGTYWKFVPKSALDDMVRNIAVINLKKCSGSAHASTKAVRQAARQDADRLKRQIQLYEPDIILTSGWGLVSNILHDEILADDAELVQAQWTDSIMALARAVQSVRKSETLVVSMPHPNRAAKCWTLELEKILQRPDDHKDCKKHIKCCIAVALNNITVPNAKKRSSQRRRLRSRWKGPKSGKEGFFTPLHFV